MSNSEQRKRTGRLPAVRCFENEEIQVRDRAREWGLSVGQFMLAAALDKPVDTRHRTQLRQELRRLGGLQKHLFNEGNGLLSREYANVLVAIEDALARLDG